MPNDAVHTPWPTQGICYDSPPSRYACRLAQMVRMALSAAFVLPRIALQHQMHVSNITSACAPVVCCLKRPAMMMLSMMGRMPACSKASTAGALHLGVYSKAGQAAVVGKLATSTLSFTANGMPYSGPRSATDRDSNCLKAKQRDSGLVGSACSNFDKRVQSFGPCNLHKRHCDRTRRRGTCTALVDLVKKRE